MLLILSCKAEAELWNVQKGRKGDFREEFHFLKVPLGRLKSKELGNGNFGGRNEMNLSFLWRGN